MICTHHPVLEKNGSSLDKCAVFVGIRIPLSVRDPMELQNVSVFSNNMMNFHRISSINNYLWLGFSKTKQKTKQSQINVQRCGIIFSDRNIIISVHSLAFTDVMKASGISTTLRSIRGLIVCRNHS